MGPASSDRSSSSEITILARILGNEEGPLSLAMARHLLTVGFSERDKARMNDLSARNMEGTLLPAEKDELLAYIKAGSLLAMLKAKARRVLKGRSSERSMS
jgi:hypothetical protein